jgi:hypothetical protein
VNKIIAESDIEQVESGLVKSSNKNPRTMLQKAFVQSLGKTSESL